MSELSRIKAQIRQYAALPEVQAGLRTIDKAIAANPLVIFDGKGAGYDKNQYRSFLQVEAPKETQPLNSRLPWLQNYTASGQLSVLNRAATGIPQLTGKSTSPYEFKAGAKSALERRDTLHETLDGLPDGQRQLTQEYYRLKKLKNEIEDSKFGPLDALRLVVTSGVAAGFGLGFAKLFTGLGTAGNVAKGINFAEAAAPGVNLASPTIGTGVKISGAAFDTALAKTAGSSLLGGWSLTDLTKTAGNVFKGAQVVQKLAGGAGEQATGSTGGGGVVDFNITGLDMPSTEQKSPIGAQTNNGATPPVIDLTSGGGGNGMPLLILAGLAIALYYGNKS